MGYLASEKLRLKRILRTKGRLAYWKAIITGKF